MKYIFLHLFYVTDYRSKVWGQWDVLIFLKEVFKLHLSIALKHFTKHLKDTFINISHADPEFVNNTVLCPHWHYWHLCGSHCVSVFVESG